MGCFYQCILTKLSKWIISFQVQLILSHQLSLKTISPNKQCASFELPLHYSIILGTDAATAAFVPSGRRQCTWPFITDGRPLDDAVQQNPTSTLTFWMLLKALRSKLKEFLSATCPIYPSVSGGQSFCSDWTQEGWSSRSEMSLEGIFSPWDDWLLHRD